MLIVNNNLRFCRGFRTCFLTWKSPSTQQEKRSTYINLRDLSVHCIRSATVTVDAHTIMKLNFLWICLVLLVSVAHGWLTSNNEKHCVCVSEGRCRRDGVVSNSKCQEYGQICCSESSLLG